MYIQQTFSFSVQTRFWFSNTLCLQLLFFLLILLSVPGIANAQTQSPNSANTDKLSYVEYTISFSQFTPAQVAKIQSFMRDYSDYKFDKTINQTSKQTEMLYVYSERKALLVNTIRKTTEHLGFNVLVRSAGHSIDIKFIKMEVNSLPYKVW